MADFRPVVPLTLLEEILYAEAGCVDADDVPALMLNVATQAIPYNTEPAAVENLNALLAELRGQVKDDDDEEEQE